MEKEENKKKDNIYKDLGNNDNKKLQLEKKKYIFQSI